MKLQKKIFSFLITLALVYPVFGQMSSSATIIVIDALGNRDSVMIGENEIATLGVDPELDEVNLYGQPWGDPEIRSIVRPYMCGWCGDMPDEMLSYNNITQELKNDYRQNLYCGLGQDFTFTFAISATRLPVTIVAKHYIQQYTFGTYFYYDSLNCSSWQVTAGYEPFWGQGNVVVDTIYILNEYIIQEKWLRIYFQPIVVVPQIPYTKVGIYPNPTKNIATISFTEPFFGQATIVNSLGMTLKRIVLNNKLEYTVDLSGFTNGTYVLVVYDSNGKPKGSTKFIVKN